MLKIIWVRWKAIAHRIGTFEARVTLTLVYFVVVCPFAPGVKLLSDPLQLRRRPGGGWLPRPTVDGDMLTIARRQF